MKVWPQNEDPSRNLEVAGCMKDKIGKSFFSTLESFFSTSNIKIKHNTNTGQGGRKTQAEEGRSKAEAKAKSTKAKAEAAKTEAKTAKAKATKTKAKQQKQQKQKYRQKHQKICKNVRNQYQTHSNTAQAKGKPLRTTSST